MENRNLLLIMRNRKLNYMERIMRKTNLENITLTTHVERSRSIGKQRATYLNILGKYMMETIKVQTYK